MRNDYYQINSWPMRILLVEDDKEISKFLKTALESECFVVDATESGSQGLFLAKTNTYDLIILDCILPEITGPEICEQLRQSQNPAPIIMLTVQDTVQEKVHGLKSGADDYVTKPFSFEELLARIYALLRRPKQIEESIYQIDNLVLNKDKHIVKRGNTEIYLTKKEFMLLHYLMKHKGTVLSRGMIIEQVWDMNADPFSNTIESHISTLRKKIDQKGKKKLIHTISGRGYKIDLKK